ncbi:Hermansky-Pudlak syndrome 6 protein [Electrophorus electricus]|uniref:HPS6 biogenesis of lysosomal organelles complex 2 subunit 3 n=1 Tax=Electrophorus electricus TaxID=8005 RepID=A0AAY5E7X3_ELEEL|nr:Hermansky-Pudlak syndrome 6 protein [Electrophorus electricus]
MTRHALEQVTDFGDFTRGKELKDFLKQSYSNNSRKNCLSNVRVSPDGRHIHVILHAPNTPKSDLMTYDKYLRPQLVQCKKHFDLVLTRDVPIVDLIYFDQSNTDDGVTLLGIIFENGKAEFWKFSERKSGWHLLQTVDLCNSPRAKINSVCISQHFIIWCEERPSNSSSVHNVACGNFRFCICKRSFDINEGGVCLGGVKTAMHNNPRYLVISSGDIVYLLPDIKEESFISISKVFLTWSPQHEIFKILSASNGTLLIKNSTANKESDFRHLVTDCIGILSIITPPDVYSFCPTGCGDLLLLLSSGWVCIMQRDGVLRQIYKLPDNCLTNSGVQNSLNIYHDILALAVGRMMYLIDVKCGLELDRITLKKEGLLFVNCLDSHSPQMLSEAGLFVVIQTEAEAKPKASVVHSETIHSSAVLVEAVFEEACKYYQQRSLSTTKLTAEKLRTGGMFQAPISLAAIISDYLTNQTIKIAGKDASGHGKLLISLDSELKSLIVLEDIKTSMVKASENDLGSYCETLVQQEICRLLSSEMDKENLQYLNSIFHLFSTEAWQAIQAVLQLRCNGAGSLSTKAPSELWKIVLSPIQTMATFTQQKHTPANAVLPVFELLCKSMFKFQPSWLPRFLELAQQQSGTSSNSSWNYGVKESSESLPLYKRVLAIVPCIDAYQDLEVELLLCSQRPNAIMQALRILIGLGEWGRVTQVAERFCRQSPLLNKEIFTTLLCEVSQHRDLDPYLDLLWALCPEDMTVTAILNIVLKNMPSTAQSSGPFQGHTNDSQPTIGVLKPLLSKVLQRETRPRQRYADILQSPSLPPPAPPRQVKDLAMVNTELDIDQKESPPSGSQVNHM